MTGRRLSAWMHGNAAAMAMITIAAVYLLVASGFDEGLPPQGEQGLCLPPPALWPLSRGVDVCGGLVLNAAVLVLMGMINKAYNVLRSVTRMQIGLFAVMAAAVPRLVVNVNSGIILALVVNLCLLLLFSCYEFAGGVRRVFLSFLLLSLGAAMQYSFVVFIPVMWLVTAQMRIFNLRTLLASLFGILTPWIILLGFGLVSPDEIHMPQVTGIFRAYEEDSAIYLMAITAFTAFLLIVAITLNITKTIAYNARARGYNGALTLTAVATVIALCVNYNNLPAYLPLLNVCAAYQITHWFVNHRFERQFVAVLAIVLIYIMFYIWRVTL